MTGVISRRDGGEAVDSRLQRGLIYRTHMGELSLLCRPSFVEVCYYRGNTKLRDRDRRNFNSR